MERRGWEAWAMGLRYFEAYRMKPERHLLRQKLVSLARERGLKAAARLLGCSRNTARKWIRRYQPGKPSTLVELSRRPRHCPHQTSRGQEGLVVRLRKQTGFGAERLKQHFDLKPSVGALHRIIRQHGLSARRRTKPQTKRYLRAIKRTWPLFGKLVADTKFLQDIPEYWPQMQHLRLPRFQYTVREVVSGLCFCGYADEVSKTYSCLMAQAVCHHLQHHGVQLRDTHWQTDNGSEFLDSKESPGLPSLVRSFGCDHRFIPPKAYTWQSDVETVHRLVEDEFFFREAFSSPTDFWIKSASYWLFFNVARKNSGKEWQTPLQIIQSLNPKLSPAIASWLSLDLNALLRNPPQGGHDLPAGPYFFCLRI